MIIDTDVERDQGLPTVVGSIPNLWPLDLGVRTEVTPKLILARQAAIISERSQGKVRGEVQTRVLGREFAHTLMLVAPQLGAYQYFLVRVRHAVARMYPLHVHLAENDSVVRECSREEEFCSLLRTILHDPQTMEVVQSLISQSD
ncbi:MAG: hypothetical protein IT368_14555 [Candidatus Hydrogenedentes bacterium]|nr:hypothetical protein [Candidatus Hydrogenedentota bacterium]